MLKQYDLIHKWDFDSLVILDACRFDMFKRVNKFKGELIKCESPAPHTWFWMMAMFPGYYDLTYFSAHPFIGPKRYERYPYQACEHFREIVPIFQFGWNERLGTVHPGTVGEVLKHRAETSPYDKGIVHYMQPHGPWIGKYKFGEPWSLADHVKYEKLGDCIARVIRPPPTFMKRVYKSNLQLVLKSLKKYKDYFVGKTVITADHGEMLGEYSKEWKRRLYLHKIDYPPFADKLLKTVPWFVWDR